MPTWLDEGEADSIELYAGGEGAEEFDESNGFGEYYGDESLDDSEASAAARRRRARMARRRRALALARARRLAPAAPPTTAKTAVRRTQAAVANLDLESKVQADALANAISTQSKTLAATQNAVAAGAVVGPLLGFLQTSNPGLGQNPFVKAAVPLAPLLLLRPQKRGEGLGAFIGDPRVLAIAAVAGLTFFSRSQEVQDVNITSSVPTLPKGAEVTFRADALDRSHRIVSDGKIEWKESSSAKTVEIDPGTGKVKAKAAGIAEITATVTTPQGASRTDSVIVTVTP